ncbi:MAG: CmcJ/NvfI family oxidoreductase, partial [Steroidobacteraceae bacterium]
MSVAEAVPLQRLHEAARQPQVTAALRYIVATDEKPHSYMYEPPAGVPPISASYEPHSTIIRSLRPIAHRLSLDSEGFRLLNHRSGVQDFYSDDEVRDRHYPEVEKLVAHATGAACVVVFDHTLRTRLEGAQTGSGRPRREPVPRVHNDYTAKSGPQRVRDLLVDEAEALLRRRFSIINVWRPIRGPLEDAPLALCDARSVAAKDLVATDLLYKDRTGETYNVLH